MKISKLINLHPVIVLLFADGEHHWNAKRFQPEADTCFWNRNASCWTTREGPKNSRGAVCKL